MSQDLSIRLNVDTSQGIANISNLANITEKEFKRMVRAQEQANKLQAEANKLMRDAGAAASSYNDIAKGAEHVGFATAGAKRELLVLAHELSQGNFTRFGGSLLVLGERTNAMALAFSAGGLAIGGAGLAMVGFAALVAHGAIQQAEFNKAVTMTGNYAGITAGQVDGLARSISAASALTVRAARDAIQATVATGAFGPQVLSQAAEAVGRLSSVTGQEAEKVAADFSKMRDGVAKFAVEYNRTAHNLTLAQYEQIRALEEAGKSQEAQQRVFDAVNAQLAQQDKNLGEVARGWDGLKKSISETADRIEGLGRDKTIEEGIVRQIDLINKLDKAINARPAIGSSNLRNEKFLAGSQGAAQDDLILLRRAQELKQTQALAAAEKARREEEAIAASDAIRRITLEFDQRAKMTAEIRDYRKELERLRAVKPEAVSAQQEADTIAKIREKYVDPAIKRANEELDRLILTQKQEDARIQGQIANLRLYGKAFNDTREEAAKMRLAEGNLPGVSQAKKDAFLAGAAQLDKDERAKRIAEETAAYEKRTKAINDEAMAREISVKDAYIQKAISEGLTASINTETAAYENRRRAAERRFQSDIVAPGIQSITDQADAQISRIREEADAMGLGALALARLNQQRQLEAKAREELRKFKGDTEAEAAAAARLAIEVARVTSVLDASYEKSRQWNTGVDKSIQRFIDDATDKAKNASTLVDGFLRQSEDAIINFARTGKLSFANLWSFMAEEFLRQQIRMAEAKLFSGGAASLIGSIGSLFGGFSTSDAVSLANILPGDGLTNLIGLTGGFSQHATGADYIPYDGYPALLHEGEMVLTKQQARAERAGSGGAVHIDFSGQTLNVGAGVSRGEFASALKANNAQLEARIQRGMRQGSFA